ncbi:Ku protein [Streptomyces sp. V1I1]|uniref:Ku protein n=1 Tax=Streptomyces sp. V1I1 TaxID=3042272 RepID=UPI00277DBDD3|nr:Ku protein [Streptomyces sp. V1I1]MDQ0938669.1 hypothetical protein [Streptomyces sp. V1I1]
MRTWTTCPWPPAKTVEIIGFVGEQDVDPLLYDRGYFAGPDGQVAQRPFPLLVEALARTGRVGIAKFAVRTRERLAVLRLRRGVLVVHALRWPQELREYRARHRRAGPLTASSDAVTAPPPAICPGRPRRPGDAVGTRRADTRAPGASEDDVVGLAPGPAEAHARHHPRRARNRPRAATGSADVS